MQSKHFIWLALIVGLAVGVIGWLAFSPKSASAPTTGGTATTTTATTTSLDGITVSGSGATVSVVSSAPKPPSMPALVFADSANLPDDAKQALQIQWNTLTGELKKEPTRVDLWLELGTTYKIAGQYDAAIATWTYVAKYGPGSINSIAYGNLGDLYLNFIHDYAKAAADYKAALSVQPNNPDYQAGYKAAQSHLQ